GAGRFGVAYVLEAPRLPDDLQTAQVYWLIDLPYSEHVFTDPVGFAAEYHWQLSRSLWGRVPDLSELELQQWIGTSAGPASPGHHGADNQYLYGATGEIPQLSFRTLRKGSLALFGAGTALALGLVLLRWPIMRHPAALLAGVFLIALAGVWFP